MPTPFEPKLRIGCDYCGELTTEGHMYAYANGARWRVCCRTCAVAIEREHGLTAPVKTTARAFWKDRLDCRHRKE